MGWLRYAGSFMGLVVGSEVIYWYLLQWKIKLAALRALNESSRIFCKVIFFPDQGILSVQTQQRSEQCNNNNNDDKSTVTFKDPNFGNTKNGALCYPGAQDGGFDKKSHYYNISRNDLLRHSSSLKEVIEILNSARHSLDICVLVFTCVQLMETVLTIKDRGVTVRVLVDRSMGDSDGSQLLCLRRANIPVRMGQAAFLMHHKFVLIDTDAGSDPVPSKTSPQREEESDTNVAAWSCDKAVGSRCQRHALQDGDQSVEVQQSEYNSTVMTGSFNWTWGAVIGNNENIVVTNAPQVVSAFAKEFKELWSATDTI